MSAYCYQVSRFQLSFYDNVNGDLDLSRPQYLHEYMIKCASISINPTCQLVGRFRLFYDSTIFNVNLRISIYTTIMLYNVSLML